MERYAHGGDIYSGLPVKLDFSVNLNPFGMPEKVKEALVSQLDSFQTYPDPQCRLLCASLGEHHRIPRENLLCGNGADDLIYRLCFVLRPKEVLVCAPGFSEYERAALAARAQVRYHKLKEEDGFLLTETILPEICEKTNLLFLCSPNNPTGKLIPMPLLEKILKRCQEMGTYLLLDECFIDFTSSETALSLMEQFPRLLILRAFTKLYAVAGLRLGYLISRDMDILSQMQQIAPCWSVSGPAQAAGVAALQCSGVKERLLRLLEQERPRVTEQLQKLGFQVWDSDCNFILFRGDPALGEKLREKGIAIRDCSNYPGLTAGFWRIGLKTPGENNILLQSIGEVC